MAQKQDTRGGKSWMTNLWHMPAAPGSSYTPKCRLQNPSQTIYPNENLKSSFIRPPSIQSTLQVIFESNLSSSASTSKTSSLMRYPVQYNAGANYICLWQETQQTRSPCKPSLQTLYQWHAGSSRKAHARKKPRKWTVENTQCRRPMTQKRTPKQTSK